MTYFCSIGSQILYIFETHGIGQTPSSLERYLVDDKTVTAFAKLLLHNTIAVFKRMTVRLDMCTSCDVTQQLAIFPISIVISFVTIDVWVGPYTSPPSNPLYVTAIPGRLGTFL